MEKNKIFKVITGLSLLLSTMGCGSSESNQEEMVKPKKDITSITYELDDATLPVENQRSYTITAEPDRANIIVEDHEDVYVSETYQITEERFTFVKNALQRNRIHNCVLSSETQCENGSMESISYSDKNGENFYGSVYHCNGRNTGNLCGDYETFSSRMRELIPNFEQLLIKDPEVE